MGPTGGVPGRVKKGKRLPPSLARPPRRTIVLDTAALLAGLGPAQAGSGGSDGGQEAVRWVVSPAVQAEVRPGGPTGRSIERALAAGLEVVGPSEEASKRVDEAVSRHGEELRLSYADREVLALALDVAAEGSVELWSDDYAVQNLARALGVTARPVLTTGIREEAHWHTRCTGCGRYPESSAVGDTCPICGSPLKRTRKAPPGHA